MNTKPCASGETCLHPNQPNIPIEDFHWRNKAQGLRKSRCKYCATALAKAQHARVNEEIKNSDKHVRLKAAPKKTNKRTKPYWEWTLEESLEYDRKVKNIINPNAGNR